MSNLNLPLRLNKEIMESVDELKNHKGMTWVQVADKLNKEYSMALDESTYRKNYEKYKLALANGTIDHQKRTHELRNNGNALIDRKDVEAKKNSLKRTTYREIVRDQAIAELYKEDILNAVSNLPKFDFSKVVVPNKVKDKKYTYIFTLSDLHYDGNFDIQEILGFALQKILEFVSETKDISKIIIIEGGDIIEGASLRPSQMRTIALGMVDQLMVATEAYATMLAELHNKTGLPIEFNMVNHSNHTQIRPHNSKRNELTDEDLLRTASWFLKERFSNNKNIKVYADSDMFLEYDSMNIVVSHGHKYKLTPNNLVQVAKSVRSYYRKRLKDLKKPTYYLFGHFHQYRESLIDEIYDATDKAFLIPALSPKKSSYEENGLMGSNPAIAVFKFNKDGRHVYTQTINTLSL